MILSHRALRQGLWGGFPALLGQTPQYREWDGEKEQIVGDPEANKLLRRDYRGPWKYPEA